jgi:hypothetical protein
MHKELASWLATPLITDKSYSVHVGCGIQDFLDCNISKKNVIYFAKDHWGSVFEIMPEIDDPREKIIEKVQKNPDQKFCIFHPWLNFESYLGADLPANLKTIKYTDEVWDNPCSSLYYTVNPQHNKNFDSVKHWISLGANRRPVRYISAMYLLGTDATKTGLLKIDPTLVLEHESWNSYLSYWNYNHRAEIFTIQDEFAVLETGFNKIKKGIDFEPRYYIIPGTNELTVPRDNHKNFDQSLRHMYQDSFVEIVNETMFMEPVGMITEKFLNSVYGFNLPIVLSVPNSVSYLRAQGFDLFDDVIDHSYDTVQEPLPRLIHALSKNMPLLQNTELAKTAWCRCQDRMQKNVEIAQQLELDATNRAHLLLENLGQNLGLSDKVLKF